MASEKRGNKAKSSAGAKRGKRSPKPKKGSLRDLDAKDADAVRGGDLMLNCTSGKHYDKVIIST